MAKKIIYIYLYFFFSSFFAIFLTNIYIYIYLKLLRDKERAGGRVFDSRIRPGSAELLWSGPAEGMRRRKRGRRRCSSAPGEGRWTRIRAEPCSTLQLRSGLGRRANSERKEGGKAPENMTLCHIYGDVLADGLKNAWRNCKGIGEGRSDTPARPLPVGRQPTASPSHDS